MSEVFETEHIEFDLKNLSARIITLIAFESTTTISYEEDESSTATLTIKDSEDNILAEKTLEYLSEANEVEEITLEEEDYERVFENDEIITISLEAEEFYAQETSFSTDHIETVGDQELMASEESVFDSIIYEVKKLFEEYESRSFILGETAKLVDSGVEDGFLANDITLLGRGDGINQLEANVFAAAKEFTQLEEEISEDAGNGGNTRDGGPGR